MNPWRSYLLSLFGHTDHGRARVKETEALTRSFLSERLTAGDLLGLLDRLEELDAFRQVFILPTVLELMGEPSRSLRSRILAFSTELLGASFGPLLADVDRMARSDRNVDKHLRRVLGATTEIILEHSLNRDDSEADDLTTLLDDRAMIFAVSLLDGLYIWLKNQPDTDRLRRVYGDFFKEVERTPLRSMLFERLSHGPLFVRHLVARWIGRTGTSLSSDTGARHLLFKLYCIDRAPVVAATAIEAYAWLTELPDVAVTVARLESELRTSSERRGTFGSLSVVSPSEAARCLSGAVLRALGIVARNHPSESAPRAALRRVVCFPPASRIDLFHTQPVEVREPIFKTALALHGDIPLFRILRIRREEGSLVGEIGLHEKVVLEEPYRSLERGSNAYWCQLATASDAPIRRFRLIEPSRGNVSTSKDLLGLITPRIGGLATWKAPRRSSKVLQERCEHELVDRATWACVAVDAISEALLAFTNMRDSTIVEENGDVEALLDFLVEMAEAAEQVSYIEERIGADGIELRNRIRGILLNRFGTRRFFERLFAHGEADQVRAKLLTSLATAAMRSVDDDEAYNWIKGNLDLLRRIAESSDYPLYDRGAAAAAVQLRIRGLSEKADDRRIVIDYEAGERKSRSAIRRVLPFITDTELLERYAAVDDRANRDLLVVRPEDVPDHSDQLSIRSEVVARALLDADRSRWSDLTDDIAICLAAAASADRNLLSDTARRRLASSYVDAPPTRRGGQVRRLFEQLIRTATGAQLLAVLRLVLSRDDFELKEYLGRLMERRLDDSAGASKAITGRHFDAQTIVDIAARREVPLAYLCRLARSDKDFVRDYLRWRRERQFRFETECAIASAGTVLRILGIPDDVLPVELRTIRRGSATHNILEGAVDAVPMFVHHVPGQPDVPCLVMVQRVPSNTVNFHVPTLPIQMRRALLDELLADRQSVRLAARVAGEGAGGRKLLDFGVPPAGLRLRMEVEIDRRVERDDIVVVQIRREKDRILVIRSARFEYRPEAAQEEVSDLRGQPDAVDWLEKRAARRTVLLRCVVVDRFERNDGTVRIFCEAGFLIYGSSESAGRQPSFVVEGAVEPSLGAEIVIAASNFTFKKINAEGEVHDSIEVVSTGAGLLEGQVIAGYLQSQLTGSGRRRWFADIGGLRLIVPRSHLTCDLRRLFELDALDNSAPFLARLSGELFEFRVLPESQQASASLVEAEPVWTVEDLTVAVASGAVERITVARVDSRVPQGMVVEVESASPIADDLGESPVLSVGTLAYVRQGELFDQEGDPVAIDALAPGVRLSLGVWERDHGIGRTLKERPRPAIHLRLTEDPDDDNRHLETMLSEGTVVTVRVSDEGTIVLADALPILPPPQVLLARTDERRFFEAGSFLDAVVARTWNPWSLEYTVRIRRRGSNSLHIDEARQADDIRFFLKLEPGDRILKMTRYRREGQNLICYAGGLRVSIDSLAAYLVPSWNKLLPEEIRSQVLLTGVNLRYFAKYESFSACILPDTVDDEVVTGLVDSTPFKGSESSQIGIRWVLGDLEDDSGEERLRIVKGLLTAKKKYFNGDVLVVDKAHGADTCHRYTRFLQGTFLHTAQSAQAWMKVAYRQGRDVVEAVVLQKSEEGNETWLFCIEPADLVEVAPSILREVDSLESVRTLDRVRLRLIRSVEGNDALHVESTSDGILASAIGARFELKLSWYDRSSGLFSCQLCGEGPFASFPPLELRLRDTDLPPGQDGRELAKNALRGERPVIQCTLDGVHLRTWRDRFNYWFEPNLVLGRYDPHRVATKFAKPSLADALAKWGRINGAHGKIVEHAGAMAVKLTRYEHDAPIPLPREEQTWFPLTGRLPGLNESFMFTILCGSGGSAYASLRCNQPKRLADWLASRHYRTPSSSIHLPIHYFGRLSVKDCEDCSIESGGNIESEEKTEYIASGGSTDWVLFEVGPGETFIARSNQVSFLGEPFDPKALHTGDEITEFEIIGRIQESEAQGPVLDILNFNLDIVEDLQRFKDGSHFGIIEVDDERVRIVELRGVSLSEETVALHRLGRWELTLGDVSEEDRERLRKFRQGQYVYLKFVRADWEHGVLVFRLATMTEIFAQNNLVYVAAKSIETHGPSSLKLDVRPLDESLEGDYFIPENLFSERKGRLQALDRAHGGGIFLARVVEVPEEGQLPGQPRSSFQLSLLRNPKRRFRYMMSHREWQVIVKKRSKDGRAIVVEAGIGVNVELPLERIGLATEAESAVHGEHSRIPSPGEILFLERVWEKRSLFIRHSVRSHVDYLTGRENSLVLTTLWGGSDYRRRGLETKQGLDCSIVGLPQLRGCFCQVRQENVEADDTVPQQVVRVVKEKGRILLTDRLGSTSDVVGRLSFQASGQPRFDITSNGKGYLLARGEITFREGTTREVAHALEDCQWRNDARTGIRSIANSDLIGVYLKAEDRVSLTAMAERPFPVDHLVEQFAVPGPERRGRSLRLAPVRSFVVAGVQRECLILEIAPGRYAELPVALIRPLHSDGKLARGLALSWDPLAPGDELSLELLPSTDSDAFLPRFRVKELLARSGRQLRRPIAVPLYRRDEHNLFLGTAEGPGVSAPSLGPILENEICELKNLESVGRRYVALKHLYMRHGACLVLIGMVVGSTEVAGGTLFFIDIGIPIPDRAGSRRRKDPIFFVPTGEQQLEKGEVVGVRVLDACFDETLTSFSYSVERRVTRFSDRVLVRGSCNEFVRAAQAEVGDSVLVYRPQGTSEADAAAAGFEELDLLWNPTEADDLHLDVPSERAEVFKHLLVDGGSFWATCEAVSERQLTLSRRLQLEDVLPAPGEVVRGKLVKALSNSRWLVHLYGVPLVIHSQRLFRGPTFVTAKLSEEYARAMERGLDIEVVRTGEGRLSAKDVYQLSSEGESIIEVVVEAGVMVMKAGCRLFVPARELTWCGELDEALLRSIFRCGDRLRVARRTDGEDRWSHVVTYDIRAEVAEMTRSQGAVSVTAIARDGERTIVRSSSGALMELRGGRPPKIGTRLVAFVQQVDNAGRRIRLTPEEVSRLNWSFPFGGTTFASRFASYSEEAFRLWLRELEAALVAEGPKAVFEWAGRHPGVRSDPENVRILLDIMGPQVPFVVPERQEAGESESGLQQLIRHLAAALDGTVEDVMLSESERFALGYRLLLDGCAEAALHHLRELEGSKTLSCSFAAGLALAVGYARTGAGALVTAGVLRNLLERLWANAVRTITIPLIGPSFFDPQDQIFREWQDALADGDLDRLSVIVRDQSIDTTSSSGLAFQVWRSIIEGRFEGLDDLVDRFFDTLRQDREESGESLDARLYVMAAFLEFSRGEVVEAWAWLDRIGDDTADLAVPAFWRHHLRGRTDRREGLDPVLVAAAAVYRRCRWDRAIEPPLLEELWKCFRASRHRWILDIPICRPLTPLPEREATALRRWAKLNRMEAGLDALIAEMDLDSLESASRSGEHE